MLAFACAFTMFAGAAFTDEADIQAKDALKKSLSQFPGTVLLVSHEESFYRGWAQRVIEIS